MTWTADIEKHINKKYSTSIKVFPSSQTRYKFPHRAIFNFYDRKNIDSLLHLRAARDLKDVLSERLQNQVKIRNDWYTTFVYFNDIDQLMSAVPGEYFSMLDRVEIMHPNTNTVIESSNEIYPVTPKLTKKLPYNRYQYRISCCTGICSIPREEFLNLCSVIQSYDGVRLCNSFSSRFRWKEKYFYAESLEWLPLLIMVEPRLIRRIERYITPGELGLETTD